MDQRVAKADEPGVATDTVVATFDVHHRRYLDPKGQLIGPAPAFAKDRDVMLSLYRAMTLTRTFDYKAVALQRTGIDWEHRVRATADYQRSNGRTSREKYSCTQARCAGVRSSLLSRRIPSAASSGRISLYARYCSSTSACTAAVTRA